MTQTCQLCGQPVGAGYRWGTKYDRLCVACLNWLAATAPARPVVATTERGKSMAGEQRQSGRQPIIREHQQQPEQQPEQQQHHPMHAQPQPPQRPQGGGGTGRSAADEGGSGQTTGATWPDVVMAVISAGWAAADVIQLVKAIAGSNLDEE